MLRILKRLDYPLLITVGILLFISVFMIFSASSMQLEDKQSVLLNVLKHLFACGVGTLFFLFFVFLDYKILTRFWWVLYLGIVALLAYILFFGHVAQGAQRWIDLGFFAFQPSEAAKLMMIVSLAALLSKKEAISSLRDLFPFLCLVGVPFLLIARQPDLGTALVFMFIFFGMLLMANATARLIFLLFSPVISLVVYYVFPQGGHVLWFVYLIGLFAFLASKKTPLLDTFVFLSLNIAVIWVAPLFWHLLKPYQQERLLVFINSNVDPLAMGVRYHIDKSVTAVGSGGLWGQGWLQGALSHLQYIPVQNSDFIFSVIGEELGLWGCSLILFLLGILVYRAVRIGTLANDNVGGLLAIGIASYFLFQIFVNVGMTMGMMPVVGIPLPFLSYGGSALVTNLSAIGLLESIAWRREKLFF